MLTRHHYVGEKPKDEEHKKGCTGACAVPGQEFSGVITAIGKDVQDFEIGDEVYGTNDWSADGATAEFCITLPRNIGPVRAMELK